MQGNVVRGKNELCHHWCQSMKATMPKHHLCVVDALGKFPSHFCPTSTQRRRLPYVYIKNRRNTACLWTVGKHFSTSRPCLLRKIKEGSESQVILLTSLWNPIGLGSHGKWSVLTNLWWPFFGHVCSDLFSLRHPTSFSSLNSLHKLCRCRTCTIPPKTKNLFLKVLCLQDDLLYLHILVIVLQS